MPKGEAEDQLLFVVPKAHWVTTLNGCHRDAGHQGHNHTLSLLWELLWWLGMINQKQQSIKSCMPCLQHEGDLPKVPLHPIVATTPLGLLHIDFTSIEMTMELNQPPRVANVLVFQDHFTKHVMANVTPDQTAKTVTKFLYQGYISIFGAPARLLSNQGTNCYEQHHWRTVYTYSAWGNCRPHCIPPTKKWLGGEITSNHNPNDWEAGRGQKGWLARTRGWDSASLQCHPLCCDWV